MPCGDGEMPGASREWESSPVAEDQRGEVGLEGLGKEHGFQPKCTEGFSAGR